jgi:hypothetical protein
MADTSVAVTPGSGASIDTRTEATNGNHRQVVVLGDPSTNAGVAPVDASAGLKVDLGADNDVTITSGTITTVTTVGAVTEITNALPAGTNAIGKLSANSGVDIGDVDVTSAIITGGSVAHDSADSGNPIKVGAKASATLSDDTMVANGDRTDATSDLDGAIITRPQFPLGDLLSERVSNTDGTSTAFTNFGATASTRNYVTAISLFNSSGTAGYVDFRDGTAGSVLFTVAVPAGGGAVISSLNPLFRTTANTALAYDVSAALTTVYISISGFKSKV